jgi:hypothetical protein
MNPPVIIRKGVEADDTPGPVIELNPNELIDEIPAGVDYKALISEQAFLAEFVTVVLQPLPDTAGEPQVSLSINDDRVVLIPGYPTQVKRYHVAQLMKARPSAVRHVGGDRNVPEQYRNQLTQQSQSRYNFDVLDDSPRGRAWVQELRLQYTRR